MDIDPNTPLFQEHIHTYEKGEEEEKLRGKENFAAPFHVDNGVLLLITPFNQHPLQVERCIYE